MSVFVASSFALALAPAARAADPPPTPDATGAAPAPLTSGPFGSVGAMAGSSTWSGDPIATSITKIGWCFGDWIGPYFLSKLGYAAQNERTIVTLSAGLQLWLPLRSVRPFARASILHQREESVTAIIDDPGGAIVGVGDAIHQRTGAEGAIGVDIPLVRDRRIGVYITVEAVADSFPDPRGPAAYVMGSGGVSARYWLF
jgi:hypothetical protein